MLGVAKALYEIAGAESREDIALLARKAEFLEKTAAELTLESSLAVAGLKSVISKASAELKTLMTPEEIRATDEKVADLRKKVFGDDSSY